MKFNQINIDVNFQSDYIPVVVLKPEVQAKVDAFYLNPIAQTLFSNMNIPYAVENYIGFENSITEIDFFKKTNLVKSYFYIKIFDNIKKDFNKKVLNPAKFCFTFDKDLTPFSLAGIKYGVITLGEKPIFYYIFIDLQELIHFIKANT